MSALSFDARIAAMTKSADRKLLPTFAQIKFDAGVEMDEPFESFGWMDKSDQFFYEDVRDELTRTGLRDFLKNCKMECDSEGWKAERDTLNRLKLTSLHSGSSFWGIIRCYRQLLQEGKWASWVKATKVNKLNYPYWNDQLKRYEILSILDAARAVRKKSAPSNTLDLDDPVNEAYIKLMVFYHCDLTNSAFDMIELLMCLHDERNAKDANDKKERDLREMEDMMEMLDFHYKNPIRWLDSEFGSSLKPGSPSNIYEYHIVEMEKRHPEYNYRDHLTQVRVGMWCYRDTTGLYKAYMNDPTRWLSPNIFMPYKNLGEISNYEALSLEERLPGFKAQVDAYKAKHSIVVEVGSAPCMCGSS
jgi:hypothetical protein